MSGKKGMKIKNRKPMSEETKRKIAETVRKRWKEQEYREKVSNAHRHSLPKEWKENIAYGMTGKKKSLETRKKMSEYQSNRTVEHERKCRRNWKKQWNSLSKEQQLKRLKKWIDAGHESTKTGEFLKPSSIEVKVAQQLDEIGINYIQQKRVYDKRNDRQYFLDFYIPSLRIAIECNGDYWHNLPDRKERDKQLKQFAKRTNHKIIFVWEHEINDEWFWIGDFIRG